MSEEDATSKIGSTSEEKRKNINNEAHQLHEDYLRQQQNQNEEIIKTFLTTPLVKQPESNDITEQLKEQYFRTFQIPSNDLVENAIQQQCVHHHDANIPQVEVLNSQIKDVNNNENKSQDDNQKFKYFDKQKNILANDPYESSGNEQHHEHKRFQKNRKQKNKYRNADVNKQNSLQTNFQNPNFSYSPMFNKVPNFHLTSPNNLAFVEGIPFKSPDDQRPYQQQNYYSNRYQPDRFQNDARLQKPKTRYQHDNNIPVDNLMNHDQPFPVYDSNNSQSEEPKTARQRKTRNLNHIKQINEINQHILKEPQPKFMQNKYI